MSLRRLFPGYEGRGHRRVARTAVTPTTPIDRSVSKPMVTASLVGSVGTLVSRGSGLLRLVVVAAVLGPTQFANLYQTSNQLPNIAFDLLAGFLLGSLMVPALVRHLDGDDLAATERLAS